MNRRVIVDENVSRHREAFSRPSNFILNFNPQVIARREKITLKKEGNSISPHLRFAKAQGGAEPFRFAAVEPVVSLGVRVPGGARLKVVEVGRAELPTVAAVRALGGRSVAGGKHGGANGF